MKGCKDLCDWFKLQNNIGPWNNERETLVVRYCDCNFRCPICYAAGYSYLHRLMRQRYPIPRSISSGVIGKICYSQRYIQNILSNQAIKDKLKRKEYVRIQGGEPIFMSYLNKDRPRLTACLAIDALKIGKKSGAEKFVCVIQTNGYYLGLKEDKAKDFIKDLINFAEQEGLINELRVGRRYRIAIEISYKAPNSQDFKIFSGRGKFNFRRQIEAYWNLKQAIGNFNGIAIYPIAGFVMPLNNVCGIVPVTGRTLPLFDYNTWDKNFRDVIDDFWKQVNTDPRYSRFKNYLLRKKKRVNLIRGEELEIRYFQRHVPSVYRRFSQFKNYFDRFIREGYFKLCPNCSNNSIYQQYSRMGLQQLPNHICNQWRNNLRNCIFSDSSRNYYPNL